MTWDPFQREVLAELGHVVYRQAGAEFNSASVFAPATAPLHAAAPASHGDFIDASMLARIARAAAMSTDDMQARLGELSLSAGLRGNPAGKRALWPRLRAMRRQG